MVRCESSLISFERTHRTHTRYVYVLLPTSISNVCVYIYYIHIIFSSLKTFLQSFVLSLTVFYLRRAVRRLLKTIGRRSLHLVHPPPPSCPLLPPNPTGPAERRARTLGGHRPINACACVRQDLDDLKKE